MSKKSAARKGKRAGAAAQAPAQPLWRQVLILVSVVPMLAGIVLFVASWFDAIWIGNATTQTVTGALLALGGFALSNVAQAKHRLALGWALLAVAVWLLVKPPLAWLFWAGVAFAVGGLALVFSAFAVRYRQVRAAGRVVIVAAVHRPPDPLGQHHVKITDPEDILFLDNQLIFPGIDQGQGGDRVFALLALGPAQFMEGLGEQLPEPAARAEKGANRSQKLEEQGLAPGLEDGKAAGNRAPLLFELQQIGPVGMDHELYALRFMVHSLQCR